MYRSEDNPSGQPPEWFEAIRAGVLGNRSEFYRFVPENPFYGYNIGGAKPSEAIIANWWRQGMACCALADYATVDSWLEDYTEDLKKITVPVLVMHGEADQVVPFASSVPRAVDLLKNGSLKTYPGDPRWQRRRSMLMSSTPTCSRSSSLDDCGSTIWMRGLC